MEANNSQAQQSAEIERLKVALANETVNVEDKCNVIEQLRADLELSQAAAIEAKNLQAQQSAEIARLTVALANETVNVETECNAKLEASKERLTEWSSLVGLGLVRK